MTLVASTTTLPCQHDPDRWFSTNPAERHDATQQCRTACPLLTACMQHARTAGEQHGVWGGIDLETRANDCGTERGHRKHLRRHEQPCTACQTAHDTHIETDRRQRLATEHTKGGTPTGYWLHWRLKEDACVPCRTALARQSKARRDAERQRKTTKTDTNAA